MSLLQKTKIGFLVLKLKDGTELEFGNPNDSLKVNITVLDDIVFARMLLHDALGFGEAFVDGQILLDFPSNIVKVTFPLF